MGQFKVKIEELAAKHIKQHFKSGDKASIKKIEKYYWSSPKLHTPALVTPDR